uniref:uncharacterized protein LOC122609068 n=1 Tax=Erigeron canadensis TaxID=72917 RepID=UPI001CB8C6C6|nr:uncharacterized protein LOC122609068 [Erigeron canadensis]
MCSTAKKMWGTLTVMFEGCSTSMESTITTLTRRYERFFSLRNESLTDTHTCFNALVNDLAAVGITKKNEVLKSKFLDSLPPKWNNYISSVKLSSVYHDLDLPGLFGLLHNQECSEAEKLIAMGDSYSQPPTALVASMTEHPSLISNEIIPCINESCSVISNIESVCSESEVEESDGDEFANEVAMLADRIRRSFGKFKGKGKSGQADKTKKPFDMSKVTCYKCGKTGHMAGDCRSKESVQAGSSKGGRNEKYSILKTKYKALKAQVAKLSKNAEKDEKSLIAKDWAESDTSSEDEEYINEKCLMGKEKFAKDLTRLQEQSESAHKASTSQSTPPEVNIFSNLSNEDKLSRLNRLGDEVLLQKHFNQEHKKEISMLKQELDFKNFTIEKLESEIKSQKQLNSILVTEAKMSEEKFLKIKQITESWCIGSKRAAKCVNIQVPHQVQAVFDGDYDRAIAISEVCAMEPCYQSPSPPKVQTKGKSSQPIRLVQKSGIGIKDPDVIGEISNDNSLLAEVSDPKIVDQSKLRSESKKSGTGKGFLKKETLIVSKKNFKSGKGQIRQQWVSKCDKNGYHDAHTWHLDSGCSKHMTGCKSLLCSFRTSAGPSVTFRDDSQGRTKGFGILSNGPLTFRRVSYVNGLKHNLISVSQLCDAGYEVRFRADKGIVLDLEGNVVLIAERDDSLYSFDMRSATVTREVCFMSKNQDELNWLWHKRLSHMNFKDINKLCKKELVSGLPVIKYEKDKLCGPCEKGKQHKASFKSKTCSTIDSCLDLLHMDLFRLISTPSFNGMRGRKPEIGFLRMFGSPCYILNQKDHLGKFEEKADEGILLGYATQMKAYRVYNKRTRTIENSVNVNIDEGCSKSVNVHSEDDEINFEELAVPENEPPSNPPVEEINAQTQGEQIEEEELPFFK